MQFLPEVTKCVTNIVRKTKLKLKSALSAYMASSVEQEGGGLISPLCKELWKGAVTKLLVLKF